MTYYKEKLYKEIFENVICLKFSNNTCIQRLESGDVALLKGELWPDNEGLGLVHRSPNASDENKRLLLSLDVIN